MANGHGGARPGAGRKKGTKDKLTRELKKTLSEIASEYTSDALATLAEIMKDKEQTGSARVAAANSILDRAHGKPVQATVELDPDKAPMPFDGWHIERAKPDPAVTH